MPGRRPGLSGRELMPGVPDAGSYDYGIPSQAPPICKYGTQDVAYEGPAKRYRLNTSALWICVLVPWAVFCAVFALMSFELHRTHPAQCLFLAICAVVAGAVLSTKALLPHAHGPAEAWYRFLGLTLLSWSLLALALGDFNYALSTGVYYDFHELGTYRDVDPTATGGARYMDAGVVEFTNDTKLDVSRALGFKDDVVYCVAPITRGDVPLATYDFWAVGPDCCNGFPGDFRCGDFALSTAHAGLRLMHDNLRPYYKLAVQQAEAEYGIKAAHPVFFVWTDEPQKLMAQTLQDGRNFFLIGCILALLVQLAGAAAFLSKHISDQPLFGPLWSVSDIVQAIGRQI